MSTKTEKDRKEYFKKYYAIKETCPVCHIKIGKFYLKKHCKSKKHIMNEEIKDIFIKRNEMVQYLQIEIQDLYEKLGQRCTEVIDLLNE